MSVPREALLKYQLKLEPDRIPLVLTYHSHLKPINKIAKNLQQLQNKTSIFTKSSQSFTLSLINIVNLEFSNFYLPLPPTK